MNPWDVESKHILSIDGISGALYSGECRWAGGEAYVCYAIEGNVVDRVSSKNGKGWCENVSPTLNTQDKHAIVYAIDQQGGKGNCGYAEDIMPTLLSDSHGTPHALCFQLCGDRDNPSVSVSDNAYCIPANPMSDRGQAVCISLEGNGARPSHQGKGFSEDGTMYTLNTIEQHSVCFRKSCKPYAKDGLGEKWVEDDVTNTLNCFEFSNDSRSPQIVVQQNPSYSFDCRNMYINKERSGTLQAKNVGGHSLNYLNPVLKKNDEMLCD